MENEKRNLSRMGLKPTMRFDIIIIIALDLPLRFDMTNIMIHFMVISLSIFSYRAQGWTNRGQHITAKHSARVATLVMACSYCK